MQQNSRMAPNLFYFHKSNNQINCFRNNVVWGFFLEGGVAALQIQHSCLITQDNAVRLRSLIQPYMERMIAVCVRNRANHRQTADAVKKVVAYHQGGTASLLFVSCLRIKIQIDDVALLKNTYHTSLPLDSPQSYSAAGSTAIVSMGLP